MKKALITGIAGQDGSFLAELLIEKVYEVDGVVRRSSSLNTQRIDHLCTDSHEGHPRLRRHYGDLATRLRWSPCRATTNPSDGAKPS